MPRPVKAPTSAELHARFDSRFVVDPSGCWLWTAATNGTYGQIRVYDRLVYAHRFAYERWVGPIPDGLTIDHLCRTPRCVNPDHLEAVTIGENIRRVPRRDVCVNGHDLARSYVNKRGWRRCKECQRIASRKWEARVREQRAQDERVVA